MEKLPNYNTGLLEGSGTKNLWLGGTIPYEVRLEGGDWRPFAPSHERQKDPLETMACVAFSFNNCLEIQYKFFGIDINFSDRFLAKMSDTTPQGNYLDKVADTARIVGLVTEEEYPNNPKATAWVEYYKPISMDVINRAEPQAISFEETPIDAANLKKQLKQSPLQITIVAPHPNHAVTLLHIDGGKAYIQDHYNYQIRRIAVSQIAYALKIVLSKPNMNQTKIVVGKDGKTVYKAVPIATDFENFKKQMSVEGIEIPNPIPPASTL